MVQKFVEFKIEQGDTPWEQIPVAFTVDVTDKDFDQVEDYCNQLAIRIARGIGQTVRWERQGVGQGHYFPPFLANRLSIESLARL